MAGSRALALGLRLPRASMHNSSKDLQGALGESHNLRIEICGIMLVHLDLGLFSVGWS